MSASALTPESSTTVECEQWRSAVKYSNGIALSKQDDRSYKSLLLLNGMNVLLIHDAKTEFSAAAMSVEVGSFDDPPDLPGLAHFCEHMLFLGTEKYPDENDYSSYLSESGGYSNAYTASEETNYHFQSGNDALEGALDRFSAFFTCPLFTETATARELQAVDSEHAKNVQSDMWRLYQLDKSTSTPGHAYTNFGTGDSRTLRDIPAAAGVDVRGRLLQFHAKHYSAGRMHLAILGREPLETLAGWAATRFAAVPNNGSEAALVSSHPYAGVPACIQRAVPVKDTRSLSVAWPAPEERTSWRAKPGRYLSHLVGHEGPGSLLSHLKARGWALGLSAGTNDTASGYSTFEVSVELTEAGLAHAEDGVLPALYAYVGMLRAAGPQSWVHEEIAAQAAASFRFANKSRPLAACTAAASSLALHPAEFALTGGALFYAYRPELIAGALACLEPRAARVRIVARALAPQCALAERWYGTQYGSAELEPAAAARLEAAAAAYGRVAVARGAARTAADLAAAAAVAPASAAAAAGEAAASLDTDPDAWARSLSPPLALPAPNAFTATDFALRHPDLRAKQLEAETQVGVALAAEAEEEEEGEGDGEADATAAAVPTRRRREPVPQLLRNDARSTVWFRGDDRFGQPKLYVCAELELPAANASPRAAVLTDLLQRLLADALTEFSYAADCADLRYAVGVSDAGLQLSFGGFSHKLAVLVASVVARLVGLTFSDAQFEAYADKARQVRLNFAKEQPLRHCVANASLALVAPLWSTADKLAAMAGLTAADLRAFQPVLLQQAHVTCLVSGNATAAEAAAVAAALVDPLIAIASPVFDAQEAPQRVAVLPRPLVLLAQPLASAAGLLTAVTGGDRRVAVTWEYVHSAPATNPEDPNSAMEYVLQIGPTAVGPRAHQTAAFRLCAHLLSEPFFDTLRTQQQLGYIVQSSFRVDAGVRAIRFIVQSNKVPAAELARRTDAFLAGTFPRFLAELTPAKFAANVAAVVAQLNEDDKTLSEEAGALWAEIAGAGRLDFSRTRYTTDCLAAITPAGLAAWYADHIAPGGVRRRCFISLVEPVAAQSGGVGVGDKEAEAEEDAAEAGTKTEAASAGAAEPADKHTVDATAKAAVTAPDAPAGGVVPAATPKVPSPSEGAAVASAGGPGAPGREDVVAPAVVPNVDAAAAVTAASAPPSAPSVTVHVTLAQAALIQQVLAADEAAAATGEGGGSEGAYAAFAEGGVDLRGFVAAALEQQRQAHESAAALLAGAAAAVASAVAAAAGAAPRLPHPTVRVVVAVPTGAPQRVHRSLPTHATLPAARLAGWLEGLVRREEEADAAAAAGEAPAAAAAASASAVA